ncbi:MAG TPA: hypothetical protein VNW52_00955 [Burkholderiaceae bacterium]|nr:hypothetical protein [Burkholderiaceae bacterium]
MKQPAVYMLMRGIKVEGACAPLDSRLRGNDGAVSLNGQNPAIPTGNKGSSTAIAPQHVNVGSLNKPNACVHCKSDS